MVVVMVVVVGLILELVLGASSFGPSVAPCELLLSFLRLLSSRPVALFHSLAFGLVCFSCGCVARRGNHPASLLDRYLHSPPQPLGSLVHSHSQAPSSHLYISFATLVAMRAGRCVTLAFPVSLLRFIFRPFPSHSVSLFYLHSHSLSSVRFLIRPCSLVVLCVVSSSCFYLYV